MDVSDIIDLLMRLGPDNDAHCRRKMQMYVDLDRSRVMSYSLDQLLWVDIYSLLCCLLYISFPPFTLSNTLLSPRRLLRLDFLLKVDSQDDRTHTRHGVWPRRPSHHRRQSHDLRRGARPLALETIC